MSPNEPLDLASRGLVLGERHLLSPNETLDLASPWGAEQERVRFSQTVASSGLVLGVGGGTPNLSTY